MQLNKIYGRFVQNKAGSGAVGRLPSRLLWLCRTFSGGGPGTRAGQSRRTRTDKGRRGGDPSPGSGSPAMGGPDQPPTSRDKADPPARGRRGRPGARSAKGRRGPQPPEAGPPHMGGPGAVQLRAASACGWGGAHHARAAQGHDPEGRA